MFAGLCLNKQITELFIYLDVKECHVQQSQAIKPECDSIRSPIL